MLHVPINNNDGQKGERCVAWGREIAIDDNWKDFKTGQRFWFLCKGFYRRVRCYRRVWCSVVEAYRYWEGEETWLGVVRQHLGQEVGNWKG